MMTYHMEITNIRTKRATTHPRYSKGKNDNASTVGLYTANDVLNETE